MAQLTLRKFEDIKIGDAIPSLSFSITQEMINQYAEVSSDFNPLHLDEEFAKGTVFKGTIAHGLMTLAFVSQTMMRWHWNGWVSGGAMNISFISPLRPGDQVIINGKIIEIKEALKKVVIELDVSNQRGQKILVGNTEVSFL